MGFKCGIVGLPNVGKSTLFNALTQSNKAEAANYPFATIEPNIGRVAVPDDRLDKLAIIGKSEKIIPKNIEKPTSEKCKTKLIICQGDTITGKQLSSLSNITNRISQLLKESNQENLIENIVKSIDQFDRTQENLDELIYLSKQEILRVEPLIKEITIAANHLNNILSTIDDKKTLNDIKLTINAARSISTKIDDMSDDFKKLTQDKELTKSIRDLTIGLSKFLNEIYP